MSTERMMDIEKSNCILLEAKTMKAKKERVSKAKKDLFTKKDQNFIFTVH
jgi:hypothetical protein